jgi:hypothetical protein
MRKLLFLGVLAGLGAAVWRYLQQPVASPQAAAAPATPSSSNGDAPTDAPTKEELYERASAMGIRGRSKMTKAELEAAISRTA